MTSLSVSGSKPSSGSPLLCTLRRFSLGAPVLHGWLIASLILLPLARTSTFAEDEPPPEPPPSEQPGSPPEPPPDPSTLDSDGDGLNDQQEAVLGTSPYNPDTEFDEISDADEVNLTGTSPLLADSNLTT